MAATIAIREYFKIPPIMRLSLYSGYAVQSLEVGDVDVVLCLCADYPGAFYDELSIGYGA